MRVPPGKLSVAELGGERDLVRGPVWYLYAEMHCVGRTGRDQADINHRSRRPRIALVDRISMLVDLQRSIEVGAFFDRPLAIVFDLTAPENSLALVIDTPQFH